MTAEHLTNLKDLASAAVVCVSASAAWLTFSVARRDQHEERVYAELPVLNALEAELESVRLMARGEYDDTSNGERWFDPYYMHAGIRSKCIAAFPRSTAAQFFGMKLARLILDLQAAIDRFRADLMRQHDSLDTLVEMKPQLDNIVKAAQEKLGRKLTLADLEDLPELSTENRSALRDMYRWNKELHVQRIGNVGTPGTIHHCLAEASVELQRARKLAGRQRLRWLFWIGHGLAVVFGMIGLWFLRAFASAFVAGTGANAASTAIPGAVDSLSAATATHAVVFTVQQRRDWFDWLGLAASLLVAPTFALIAALRGAKAGGAEARRAALETQEREAAEARRVRAEERAARRSQMCARVGRTLRRIVALSEGLPPDSDLQALSTVGAEVRISAERFERASSDLHLVGAPDLESRIEAFVAGLHAAVAGFEAAIAERNEQRQAAMASVTIGHRALSNVLHEHDPKDLVDAFRALLIERGKEAAGLLVELERLTPEAKS